ncbi:MAG: hypothetical protein HOW73_00505 [Polyangiaceae bacterium]|nr:hypothetical protein [Polyangiaceae bacterium]
MRRALPVSCVGGLFVLGCSTDSHLSEEPQASAAIVASPPAGASADESSLFDVATPIDGLTPEDVGFGAAVDRAAAAGPTVRAAAAQRVIALANERGSTAWRERARPLIEDANTRRGFLLAAADIDFQLRQYQLERMAPLFSAMRKIDTPSIRAWLYAEAAHAFEDVERRRVALALLHALGNAKEVASPEVTALDRALEQTRPNVVPDAAEVLQSMQRKLSRCGVDHAPGRAVRLDMAVLVDAAGHVKSARALNATTLTPLELCLVEALRWAQFAPTTAGERVTLVIPFAFQP